MPSAFTRFRQTMTIWAPPRARRLTAANPTPDVAPETTHTLPTMEAVVVFWIARLFSMNISSSGSPRFVTAPSPYPKTLRMKLR